MKRLPIRWKLTLWYCGVLAAILLLFSAGVYSFTRYHLLERTDRSLSEALDAVEEELEESSTSVGLQARLHRRFGHYEHLLYDIRYLGESNPLFSRRLSDEPFPSFTLQNDDKGPQHFTFVTKTGEGWRIAQRRIDGPEGELAASVAASLVPEQHESWELLGTLAGVGLVALVAALVGGYILARRALAPIDRMTRAAQEISARDLDRRIVTSNEDDELGRLATTLNGMIARLAKSVADMRQFTADAEHELRTPLAIIRTETEVALRSPRSPEEYRRSLEMVLEEVGLLSQVADQLLHLCREEADMNQGLSESVQFDEVVKDVVGHFETIASNRHIHLSAGELVICRIHGDPEQLRHLVLNLLDNAIKFTPEGGDVRIVLQHVSGLIALQVSDTGVGSPSEHLDKIFNRFYRVDPARERGGTGLGLSICRTIAESHGGKIAVQSEAGKGTTFTVMLPSGNS